MAARVRILAAGLDRIQRHGENPSHKLAVGDPGWVEHHIDRLRMAGSAIVHRLVSCSLCGATGIAGGGTDRAAHMPEHALPPAEAAAGEHRGFPSRAGRQLVCCGDRRCPG